MQKEFDAEPELPWAHKASKNFSGVLLHLSPLPLHATIPDAKALSIREEYLAHFGQKSKHRSAVGISRRALP